MTDTTAPKRVWAYRPKNAPNGEWSFIDDHHAANGYAADGHWDVIEYALAAQPSAGAQNVDIVPPHCTGASLSFEPGVLHVSKDGSGYIAIDEGDFSLEDDRCEGPDGPEGSVHWITRLDASEMVALRDFLNGSTATPAHPDTGGIVKVVPRKPTDRDIAEILYNINRKRSTGDLTEADVREVMDNYFYNVGQPDPAPIPDTGDVAALREALEPFIDAMKVIRPDDHDTSKICLATVADYRRLAAAYAALAAAQPQSNGETR